MQGAIEIYTFMGWELYRVFYCCLVLYIFLLIFFITQQILFTLNIQKEHLLTYIY